MRQQLSVKIILNQALVLRFTCYAQNVFFIGSHLSGHVQMKKRAPNN